MKTCKCGTEFKPKDRRQINCSDLCRTKARAVKDKIRKQRDHPPKDCYQCGDPFKPKTGNVKYCSNPCRNKANNTKYGTKELRAKYKVQRQGRDAIPKIFLDLDENFYSLVRPKTHPTKRVCLRCRDGFTSNGAANRMCSKCHAVVNQSSFLAGIA